MASSTKKDQWNRTSNTSRAIWYAYVRGEAAYWGSLKTAYPDNPVRCAFYCQCFSLWETLAGMFDEGKKTKRKLDLGAIANYFPLVHKGCHDYVKTDKWDVPFVVPLPADILPVENKSKSQAPEPPKEVTSEQKQPPHDPWENWSFADKAGRC